VRLLTCGPPPIFSFSAVLQKLLISPSVWENVIETKEARWRRARLASVVLPRRFVLVIVTVWLLTYLDRFHRWDSERRQEEAVVACERRLKFTTGADTMALRGLNASLIRPGDDVAFGAQSELI
jgi:hypothetical protein